MAKRNTWESIVSRIDVGIATECWPWCASLSTNGYAQVSINNKLETVHVLVWEEFYGVRRDPKKDRDHLCRNRKCCNPHHVEEVDPRTNMLRGESPAAINARKILCPKGHKYTPENTFYYQDGRRACRICQRLWEKAKQVRDPIRYRALAAARQRRYRERKRANSQ